MFWLAQVGVELPEFGCQRARQFDEFCIAEVGHAQFGHTALAHADEVAGATQSQVFLGEAETIVGILEHVQAFLGCNAGIGTEDVAVRLRLATPNTATELVELREAKAVGIFDDHHGSIGYVDTDLDDRGGNEDVQFVVAETPHGLVFLSGLHRAVEQAHALMREDFAAQAFIFTGGGFDGQRLGFFDEGADDKSLMPIGDLVGDERVGFCRGALRCASAR